MRILDADAKRSLHSLQLYFTQSEAVELREALDDLLKVPDAVEHRHVLGDGRELSFSIITPSKLKSLETYTEVERRVLQER